MKIANINKNCFRAGLLLLMLSVTFGTVMADKKAKSDNKDHAKKGDFSGSLVLSGDTKAFIKHMQAAKKSGKVVIPASSTEVSKGKEAVVFVFFSGCKADKKTKKCDATISFKVVKPDNKVYVDVKNRVLSNGMPPKKGTMMLSEAKLGIVFEKKDPKGSYKVVATVTDKVAKKTLKLSRAFTVK